MKGVITFLCLVAASLACTQEGTGSSGSGLTGDPSRPDCGFRVADPPPPITPDPCTGGTTVFGPERFQRGTGTPEAAVRHFSVPAPGAVCVRVSNAGVSSAEIQLDGMPLIPPSRFNPHITEITERAAVVVGDHVLGVSVRSSPGSAIEAEVRFAPGETASYGRHEGRFLAAQNLRDDPDPFSPGDVNGVRDTTMFGVAVDVRRLPGGPTMTYRLRTTFEIADPVTCSDTRRLVVDIPVVPGTVPRREVLSLVWDGRDATGALVPDGGYFYRAVVELIRTTSSGRVSILERVDSEIQRVTVDNTAPRIIMIAPAVVEEDPPSGVVRLSKRIGPTAEARGAILDAGTVVDATLTCPAMAVSLPPRFFSVAVPLVSGLLLDEWPTPVTVQARDEAGNTARREWVFVVAAPSSPGRVFVGLHPDASIEDSDAIFVAEGAQVLRAERDARYFVVAAPPGDSPAALAERLRTHGEVAYAAPSATAEPASCPSPPGRPNDTDFASYGSSWYLDNDPSADAYFRYACVGGECPGTGETCVGGWCECGLDADCQAGFSCRDSVCRMVGHDGADIGWVDAIGSVCSLDDPARAAVIALLEALPYDIRHPEVVHTVYVNSLECCGAAACPDGDGDGLADCRGGEVWPGRPCATDAECAPGEWCLVVPAIGRCTIAAKSEGENCASDTDCFDTIPFTPPLDIPGQCDILPSLGWCTDGAPGRRGFDDDGDGAADRLDREVATLAWQLCNNWRVDVAACAPPGGCPSVEIDDDGDGVPNDCGATTVGYPEDALVAWDDDEDGVIDDAHGANFRAAETNGELFASTVAGRTMGIPRHVCLDPAHPSASSCLSPPHSGTMATVIGGTIDNSQGGAGVHPQPRILLATFRDQAGFYSALRYALAREADVVNASVVMEIDGAAFISDEQYATAVESAQRAWDTVAGPGLLLFAAATNTRDDLDALLAAPRPDAAFLVPQHLDDARISVIAATNIRDEFADFWFNAWPGRLPGTPYGGGGSGWGVGTVDYAAPGDSFRVSLFFDADDPVSFGRIGATSAATAISSAAAGLVVSAFPASMRRHPRLLLQRLAETLALEADSPGLATLRGRTRLPGRVDVQKALDPSIPLPAPGLYEDESFRLGDSQLRNTHDLDFIDSDGNHTPDFLLEVYGGPFPDFDQPRLFVFDTGGGSFRDETLGSDGLPGGAGAAADRLPDLSGNYNKADAGDLDGDGCADIVLAGFLQHDPGGTLRGFPNRVVLQVLDPLAVPSCTGRFLDGTTVIPTRDDMTRDVDLLDFDGDGDLDIFFTNAQYDLPGGEFNDQLLRNTLRETGSLSFVDETALRLPPPPRPGDPHRAGAAACDVDFDHDLDIVQATNGERNRLLINDAGLFSDRALDWNFPLATGFSHDLECGDWFLADGTPGHDNYPELLFARRDGLKEILLVNQRAGGTAAFVDRSDLLPDVFDTTQEVEVCDLDDNGIPEIILGNGDIVARMVAPNRLLEWDSTSGRFQDRAAAFGFMFDTVRDLTEDIECGDGDGDGRIDMVLVGNVAQRNWLYWRSAE